MAAFRTISEPEFKRLCGAVWAESVIEPERTSVPSFYQDRECALLRSVLMRLHHRLGTAGDDFMERFEQRPDQASLYRDEIERIMTRSCLAPFDYNRIINRLVRELVKVQTV